MNLFHNDAQTGTRLSEVIAGQPSRLLLVGKDASLRRLWKSQLSEVQWTIREAHSGADALEKLLEQSSELMLLDPNLPDLDVHEFEAIVRSDFPGLQIITLAPHSGISSPATVSTSVDFSLSTHTRMTLRAEGLVPTVAPAPSNEPPAERGWHELIGASAVMRRVYHAARLVSRRSTTVLIQGESGTGKDLLARAIHTSSSREKQPFIVINCAAIPEALLEAELFGYTKGAFTGAAQARIGRIHAAHGGTLFLDEIGDMPYPLQSKILRFLEQGEVQRIGGSDTLKVDCRIVAATNANLKALVQAKLFREDLYYRLAIFPIQLPPLRERLDDLPSLTEAFVQRFSPGLRVTDGARHKLLGHDWPGNVRELRNVIERATLYADGSPEVYAEHIVL